MEDYKKPSMQIIDIELTNILCSSVVDKLAIVIVNIGIFVGIEINMGGNNVTIKFIKIIKSYGRLQEKVL
jgi:hypothetical protein